MRRLLGALTAAVVATGCYYLMHDEVDDDPANTAQWKPTLGKFHLVGLSDEDGDVYRAEDPDDPETKWIESDAGVGQYKVR